MAPKKDKTPAAVPDPARARTVLARLAKAYPDWGPTLDFTSPFELLVATILAAQARDERINEVTRSLFKKYAGPADYVRVPLDELERDLVPTGFFRQKARAVKSVSQGILDEFGGEVPRDVDALVTLKGVGRKTASIVAGAAYGTPAIGVDRHVERVTVRLGLSAAKEPEGIEMDLRAVLPRKDWIKATWCFVLHGRRTCMPTPLCPVCPVLELCPYPAKTKALAAPQAGDPSAEPSGRDVKKVGSERSGRLRADVPGGRRRRDQLP